MEPSGDDDESEDDKSLWAYVTRDVKPLSGRNAKHGKPRKPPGRIRKPEREDAQPPARPRNPPQSRDVDKRTAERVRRGDMEIEGRLDLHGLTQKEAHVRLNAFILKAYERENRYLLVITGKGLRNPKKETGDWTTPAAGVLRKRVPEWLDEPPLRDIVLQVSPAQPHHGGSGALYVLLRRKRPAT